MTTTPSDPIQDLIDTVTRLWIKAGFQFEFNTEIMSAGMKYYPQTIVTTQLFFERLDTEDIIRKKFAQYRSSQQLVKRTKLLCASLFAAKRR